MALSEPYVGSFTASTTELSFVSGTSTLQSVTDDGVYQLFLDVSTLAQGDVFEIRVYEKVQAAGTKRVCQMFVLSDAQGTDGAIAVFPPLQLMHGWDMTIDRTAGADRVIEYSIRKIA
jgi:hypothetical protein